MPLARKRITVRLLGSLGEKFGSEHTLYAKHPAEAIYGLRVRLGQDWEDYFKERQGERYFVIFGGQALTEPELFYARDAQELILVPAIEGEIFGLLAGAILAGGGFFLSATASGFIATLGTVLASAGTSLLVSGIAQLFGGGDDADPRESSRSSAFSSVPGRGFQGQAVPLLYGEFLCRDLIPISGYSEVVDVSQLVGNYRYTYTIDDSTNPISIGDSFTIDTVVPGGAVSKTVNVGDDGTGQPDKTVTDIYNEFISLFNADPVFTQEQEATTQGGLSLQTKDGFDSTFDSSVSTTSAATFTQELIESDLYEEKTTNTTFKILYLIGEGEIEGFADSNARDSVYFNDQKLSVLDSNNLIATPVLRTGTPDQTAIADADFDFGNVHVLLESPSDGRIAKNQQYGGSLSFEISPEFDQYSNLAVAFRFRLVLVRVEAADYGNSPIEDHDLDFEITITGQSTTNQSQGYTIVERSPNGFELKTDYFALDGDGPYTVTIEKTSEDAEIDIEGRGNTARLEDQLFLRSYELRFSSAVTNYANYATLAVAIPAQPFEGNLPSVGVRLRGLKVPEFETDGMGSPTGALTATKSWSDNPARCALDLLLNERYGLGGYITEDSTHVFAFYEAAAYCDELLASGDKRYTFNGYLRERSDALELLRQFGSNFATTWYWAGGSIVPAQDRPKTSSYTFDESNVTVEVDDSGRVTRQPFDYSSSRQSTIHTAVLVEFTDKDNLHRPDYIFKEDANAIARYGLQIERVRGIGITSRNQAERFALARLFDELLRNRLVTFQSGAMGLSRSPGEVVTISDPLLGNRDYILLSRREVSRAAEYEFVALEYRSDKYAIVDNLQDLGFTSSYPNLSITYPVPVERFVNEPDDFIYGQACPEPFVSAGPDQFHLTILGLTYTLTEASANVGIVWSIVAGAGDDGNGNPQVRILDPFAINPTLEFDADYYAGDGQELTLRMQAQGDPALFDEVTIRTRLTDDFPVGNVESRNSLREPQVTLTQLDPQPDPPGTTPTFYQLDPSILPYEISAPDYHAEFLIKHEVFQVETGNLIATVAADDPQTVELETGFIYQIKSYFEFQPSPVWSLTQSLIGAATDSNALVADDPLPVGSVESRNFVSKSNYFFYTASQEQTLTDDFPVGNAQSRNLITQQNYTFYSSTSNETLTDDFPVGNMQSRNFVTRSTYTFYAGGIGV